LAVGTDSATVQVFNLKNPGKPLLISGHNKTFVNDVEFLPDNSGFISAGGDKTIRFNDHKTGESKLLLTLPYDLKTISLNKSGTKLVGGSTNGKVVLIDLESNTVTIIKDEAPNRVISVAYHPVQNKIAYGLEVMGANNQILRGLVKVVDMTSNRIKELGGHKSGVSAIEFSPDGSLMATASLDRILQLWVVEHEEDLPIVMDNNNGFIWSIGFSKESDYLLASCNDGEIRIWPTNTKMLADIVCPSLTRSMTKEEWDIYVGEKIQFEKTCEK
jgi:WD40 repeat protein